MQIGVVKGCTLSDISRYVNVSIPKAIVAKIDVLIGELEYWPSRSAFVREACLEKISREEWRVDALRDTKTRIARSERGEGPRRGTKLGSPRETAWRLDASGLIAQIERVSE